MKQMIRLCTLSLLTMSLSLCADSKTDTNNPVANFADLVRGRKAGVEKFKQELSQHSVVVVKCFTTTCPPCKAVAPKFDKLAQDYRGKARFIGLNCAMFDNVVAPYKVQQVPTFLVFSNGKLHKSLLGAQAIGELRTLVGKLTEATAA